MGRAGPPRYPCRMDLALEPLRPTDRDRLIELCRACTDFFELIEGRPGGAESADELLLASQRVMPKRLLDDGFTFLYPELAAALTAELGTKTRAA